MTIVGISVFLGITLLFLLFFIGIETAFVSANRLSIELKKKQGRRSGAILSDFFERSNHFLGACLVGIIFFLVLTVQIAIQLFAVSLWKIPFFARIQNQYLFLAADCHCYCCDHHLLRRISG